MFKKSGGVKKSNVAVFGGGELDDATALKRAREQQRERDGDSDHDEAFGRREETEYPGIRREESLATLASGERAAVNAMGSFLQYSALSEQEQALVPEKVLRGIMFIVNGLGLTESYEADALLDDVRKQLDRDFKRDKAQAMGGTLSFAKMRSTQRMEATAVAREQSMRIDHDASGSASASPAAPGSPVAGPSPRSASASFAGGRLPHPDDVDDDGNADARPEDAAAKEHNVLMMTTFSRAVDFKLLGPEDERFRSDEQRVEDEHVARFSFWAPYANLAIFVVQMYIVLAVLIRVGFEVPIPLHVFILDKIVVDLPMLLKIVVSFYALHDDGSGVPKYRPRQSAEAYIRSGSFFIDVLGLMPFDLIGHLAGSRTTLLTGRAGFVAPQWNLNRLLQCRGMFDSFEAVIEELMLRVDVHPSLARLVLSNLVFLVSVHVVSCMVFFLLYLYPTSFVEWFRSDTLAEADLFDQYIAAFDWASKNMVGMSRGSAFPSEELQMVTVVFVTSFGVCIYGLLMANLSAYVERQTPESELQQTIDEVLDTAEYVGMPDAYTKEIIAYYQHASASRHHTQDVLEVVEDLPADLGEEIVYTVGRDVCHSVPLLRGEADNQRFVLQLMDAMVPVMLLPGSTVFRRDDVGDSMYIVVSGELTVLSPNDDVTPIAHLGPGSVVGEIALVADVPRTATVVTAEGCYTDCLAIDSDAFGSLLEQFPLSMANIEVKVAERIEELAKRQEAENRRKAQDAAAAGASCIIPVVPNNGQTPPTTAAADSDDDPGYEDPSGRAMKLVTVGSCDDDSSTPAHSPVGEPSPAGGAPVVDEGASPTVAGRRETDTLGWSAHSRGAGDDIGPMNGR